MNVASEVLVLVHEIIFDIKILTEIMGDLEVLCLRCQSAFSADNFMSRRNEEKMFEKHWLHEFNKRLKFVSKGILNSQYIIIILF